MKKTAGAAASIGTTLGGSFGAAADDSWEYVTGTIDVPSDSTALKIILSGDAIFDGIELEKVELPEEFVYVSDLEYMDYACEGSYKPWIDNDSSSNNTGKISIGAEEFDKGIRLHPGSNYPAFVTYNIENMGYSRFTAYVGKDRAAAAAPDTLTQFIVYGDDKVLAESPKLKYGEKYEFDVNISGVKELKLLQNDGGDGYAYDGGCWAMAKLHRTLASGKIVIESPSDKDGIELGAYCMIKGYANADTVSILADGKLVAENIPVDQETFRWQYDLALNGSENINVEAVAYIAGERGESASVVIKRAGSVIYLSDLTANVSSGMDFAANGRMSIGNGALTGNRGFVIRPLNGSGASAAADVAFDIENLGYTYFESAVGLSDGNNDQQNSRTAAYVILADNKVIYESKTMKSGQTAAISCEIPAGTKKLVLRTLNDENKSVQGVSAWIYARVGKGVSAVYPNGASTFENGAQGVNVSSAAMQANITAPLTGLALSGISGDEIGLNIYNWRDTYQASIGTSPVYSAKLYDINGENVVIPVFTQIPAGEYLFEITCEGGLKKYSSDIFGLYCGGVSEKAALGAKLFFAEEADAYFTPVSEIDDMHYVENTAAPAEKQRAESQYKGYLNDLSTFPVTFKIADKQYNGFNGEFELVEQSTGKSTNSQTTTSVLKHTSGLTFELISVYYPEYAAFDFTLYFSNDTKANSPIVSDVRAKLNFVGNDPHVITSTGDSGKFAPLEFDVTEKRTFAPSAGRSTEGAYPYYNLEIGDGGALIAVGWTQQWSASFDKTADGAVFEAGQEVFSSYLKPGETARTPLFAFVLYDGRNEDRATNLWRRWFIDCNMERTGKDEDKLFEPQICGVTSEMFAEMTQATDENQINGIKNYIDNGIKLTYWWMDAGWYFVPGTETSIDNPAGWLYSGGWSMDTKRFPSRMRDISRYGESVGVKTLLWFEPEIVRNTSLLKNDGTTIKPEWMIPGTDLVNLGNDDALEWIKNKIFYVMDDGEISLYREDYGTYPLGSLRSTDVDGRRGMLENKYVQNHLKLWDEVNERFPDAVIDSCASGGKRNDLETLRRAVPLHKTDYNYRDSAGQQGYHVEMAAWMPYFGTKADGDGGINAADRFALRTSLSAFVVLGYNYNSNVDYNVVRDIMDEHAITSQYIYKDYYKLTDWNCNEIDWTAWEYINSEEGHGYAQFFRKSYSVSSRTFKLKGLKSDSFYDVWFEDMNAHRVMTGAQLMYQGIEVSLPAAKTSDILWFAQVGNGCREYTRRSFEAYVSGANSDGTQLAPIASSGDYYLFSVRMNMALRDTILENGEGNIETGLANEYAEYLFMNNNRLSKLLASDPSNVKIEYDVKNLSLNVYIKKSCGVVKTNAKNSVQILRGFGTYEGVTMSSTITCALENGADDWSAPVKGKVTIPVNAAIKGEDIAPLGEEVSYTALVYPVDADQGVSWSVVCGTGEGTIAQDGTFVGTSEGTVLLVATSTKDNTVTASKLITVKKIVKIPPQTIEIEQDSATIGEKIALKANVLPEDAFDKTVKWEIYDFTGSADITAEGVLTAKTVGKVVVKATSVYDESVYVYKLFTINEPEKISISTLKVKLSATLYTYDGKVKKPAVTVTDANGAKVDSSNYTATYASGRKTPGTYTVKITMKGSYTGSKTLTFAIRGKQMSVSKLMALSKGFKATWVKQSYVTGYQVQYSTSSKFTSKTTKQYTITKYTTTSKTVTKLKAKTKYYVRVRSYKTTKIGGKNYNVYSAWSKAKAVTTKK